MFSAGPPLNFAYRLIGSPISFALVDAPSAFVALTPGVCGAQYEFVMLSDLIKKGHPDAPRKVRTRLAWSPVPLEMRHLRSARGFSSREGRSPPDTCH